MAGERPANVNVQPYPTVEQSGNLGGGMTNRASPEDFGSQVGGALSDVGGEAFQQAQKFQETYNDSLARDSMVAASQKLGDLENQYRQNKGTNAATAYPVFQKQSNDLYEDTANSLPNPMAQKMFRDQFSKEIAYSQKNAGIWAADQTDAGYIASLNAGIGNSVNQFAMAGNDPQRRQEVIRDLQDQTLQAAHFLGDSPEVADMKVSKAIGTGYEALIKQTASSNPELAKQLYDEAQNGSITVNRPDANGDMKQVKVPYMDAEQSGQISAQMNTEYRRQATQSLQEANMAVTNGRPYDKVSLSYYLKNGGFDDNFVNAETTRLDSLLGSNVQKNTDMHISINGGQVLNNAPISFNPSSPLSVRNNNPGNIKDPATGEFKQFNSPIEGLTAMQSDLAVKISGNSPAMKKNFGDNYQPTLSNLISTWAQASQNNTSQYISTVSKETGIAPNQVLTSNDINKLMPAMIKVEGGGAASNHFGRNDPATILNGAEGNPMSMFQIARNLTAVTPLSDDIKTLDNIPDGPAHEIAQNAVQVKAALLAPNGDPAGYIMSHNDLLAPAQQEAFKKPNDIMPNGPVDAPNISNMSYYIKTMDNVYDSMNQPLTNRPILSTDVGTKMVANITAGGTQSGIKQLEDMKANYGENFNRVYSDLVRYGLPTPYQVAMGIDNPVMRQRLTQAYSAPEQNAKETADVEKTFDLAMGGKGGKGLDSAKTTVDQTIDGAASAFKPYTASLSASGATPKDIAAYTSVVKRLAYQGVLNGEAPDKAAQEAVNALAGQFSYGLDKSRIPKTIAPVIERNANTFRDNVTADQIHVPSYAESPDLYINSIKHASEYITNNDGSGLWLKDQSGYLVSDKNGHPITIPFTMAQHMAQQDRAKKAADNAAPSESPDDSTGL